MLCLFYGQGNREVFPFKDGAIINFIYILF
jgi:hypothetical protein